MRKKIDCPRLRQPVRVELLVDGAVEFKASAPPTGLSGDGPSKVYTALPVAPGLHHIEVRMRDGSRDEGYDYRAEADAKLTPAQNYVIGFDKAWGGFQFGSVSHESD